MPPSPAPSEPRPRRGLLARSVVVLAATACLAMLAAGCEYFTSERLAKLKPVAPGAEPSRGIAAATEGEAPPADGSPQLTAAQVVVMLERTIRGNEGELDDLTTRVDSQNEMEEARDVFQHLDDLKQSLVRERGREGDSARAAELNRQAATLEKPWSLARERLDLDLRARMLILERIDILQTVLAHDHRRLESILTTGNLSRSLEEKRLEPQPPTDQPEPVAPPTPAPATTPPPAAPAPAPIPIPIVPGLPTAAPDQAAPAAEKKADAPAAAGTEPPKAEPTKDAAAAAEKKTDAPPPSQELVSAKQALEARSSTVRKLHERSITLDARVQNLERSLDLVRELVEISRKSVANATETRDFLQDELTEGKPSAAVQAWTHDGGDALGAMDRRIRSAGEDEKRLSARFDEMAEERALVMDALRKTSVSARAERAVLEKTRETVEALESPFSSHNIRLWFQNHGPPILGTIVVMSLLYLLVSRYAHKLVRLFASRGLRGSKAERDNRMDTLVGVLQNTGSVMVLAGGISTLMSQVGIPIGPLLGGAAVAGVAVAFGAQNLIKDFFYGFMILLENQYKLKDIVRIGDHSGQVEQITLRMTALRDGDGALHFLPNGATTSVVNLTHGWSSASFVVRVAWDEDVDRVIAIITELGKEIRQDPKLRLMIVDELNMMGVDALTDTAVVIVFSIKTLPLQQWNVKREFLKRLKKKFRDKEVRLPPQSLGPPSG